MCAEWVLKNSTRVAASLALLGKNNVKSFCVYAQYFFVPKNIFFLT